VDGKGEENLISMVDELTKKIKINLKLTQEEIASDIDEELGKITTSSTQAYQYYDEGRNLHHKAEYRESIHLMEKALALDPGFAMAYRSMAMSYNNLLMFSDGKKYLQKAFELKDRLSDRERYLIEGEFFRYSEKSYPKAIEAYTKLLKLYPDDTIAGTNLGILYSDVEEWDKAIDQYQVQIQNRDKSFFAYGNQSDAYMAKGMYEKAREVLELYIATFGEHASIREDLALNYFLRGDYDLAFVEAKKVRSSDPDNIWSIIYEGIISHCRGDYVEAEKKYLEVLNTKELGYHLYARVVYGTLNLLKGKMTEVQAQFERGIALAENLGDNWWKAVFFTMLSNLYLKSGNPEKAIKESDLAWNVAQDVTNDLRWQRRALFYKGLSYLGMKSPTAARKTADELKRLCDEGMNKKEIRLYHHLRGMIELDKKNYSSAIEYFQRAISLLPYQNELGPFTNDQALFAEPLALAYYNSGDKEKARKEYENILSMTMGRLYQGEIFAKAYYMLGRIDEEQGLNERAKEHYGKFLSLWKDADPGLPEVEEAKKRLAALK
jgi:tetratricopeptide (TPR) repeat protein